MPTFDIDLTTVGLIEEGTYVGTINKVEYQIKEGEKWNKDGVITVDRETFEAYPKADNARLHLTIGIAGKGHIFHDLYLTKNALGFLQQFCKAAGVTYGKSGFNPDDFWGKQVGVRVGIKEDDYGTKNTYVFTKA